MVLDSELLLCSVVPIRLPRVSKILNRVTRYSSEKNVKYVSRLGGDIGFDHTDVHACKLFFIFFSYILYDTFTYITDYISKKKIKNSSNFNNKYISLGIETHAFQYNKT